MSVRLKIPQLRARLNRMSQAELAQKSGLSKTTISNLESGRLKRIELDTIAKLCLALGCTPNDIFVLPQLSEKDIAARQRNALSAVLSSLRYDQGLDANEIDNDLARLTNDEFKLAGGKTRRKSSRRKRSA